jgi:Tol biopolymer transport system component/DNA-binding winged helix-turn-helix (wHTH) protein
LTRNGIRVRLQPQQARLLTLLTSQPGRVYRREEIYHELWSDQAHGNFDQSLNFTVSQLRTALKDSAESSHYIETIPKLGYRFVAVVRESAIPESAIQKSHENGSANGLKRGNSSISLPDGTAVDDLGMDGQELAEPSAAEAPNPIKRSLRLRWLAVLLTVTVLGILAAAWWYLPLQPPRAYGFGQITTSDAIDFPVKPVTDGARIFYIERAGGHWITRQTSLGGGEAQTVPSLGDNTRVMDISPDRTTYLLGRFTSRGSTSTLWLMPVQGGQPQRLGEIVSGEAVFHPDGKRIVFAKGNELWVVETNGADPKRLVSLPGSANWLAWSPDGERMRLTIGEDSGATSLWEMRQDGSDLHRMFASGSEIEDQCCGEWTPDGRYFIFTGGHKYAWNLWAIREPGLGWQRAPRGPFQLTEWPAGLFGASVSPDGESVLFYAGRNRSQIQRYDLKSKRLTPVTVEGFSQPDFSLDGRWMVYVDINGGIPWKMDTRSGEKVRLSPVGFSATFPRWSPDGSQLAMTARDHALPGTVYLISATGGTPEQLLPGQPYVTDPDWSPDGKTLVVVHPIPGQQNDVALFLVDLATRKETMVTGSKGRFFPHWSPDGRHIAAYADDGHGVDIYSFATHKWTSIVTAAAIGFPSWSRDSSSLYYQKILEDGQPVYRFNMRMGHTDMVARFDDELAGGISRCALMGLAPDGALLLDTTRGSRDLYRAKLTLPR